MTTNLSNKIETTTVHEDTASGDHYITVHYAGERHGVSIWRTRTGENYQVGWYATNATIEEAERFHNLYAAALKIAKELK